jgi:hypothetical protein
MKKIVFFLVLSLFLTSCTQIKAFFTNLFQPPEFSSTTSSADVINTSIPTLAQLNDIVYPFYEKGLLIDCESHIHDIKRLLGEPHAITTEKNPNPHIDSQIDEIHELFYNGLSFFIYVFEKTDLMDDTNIMIGFTLTGKQYFLPDNIKIGSSLAEVKKYFKPLRDMDNFFLYYNLFEEDYQEEVRFYFAKDKLFKVHWLCSVN